MAMNARATNPAPRTAVVLIADADAAVRASIRYAFDGSSYEVHESEDGAEALGKALCHRPGVIIAESDLPRIDGVALCRLLRSDPATRDTSIIMIASAPFERDRVRNAGADQVLDRDCTPEAVVMAARQLLDRDAHPTPRPPEAEMGLPADTIGDRRQQRGAAVRGMSRMRTFHPPQPPPPLICPVCQRSLVYQHSHTGGVNARSPEQWDYFKCPGCGPFQYRHRTRTLKSA
jgi:CheY-like chemotaxis protein